MNYREKFPDATDMQLRNERRHDMECAWAREAPFEGRLGKTFFWGEQAVPAEWRERWYAEHPLG